MIDTLTEAVQEGQRRSRDKIALIVPSGGPQLKFSDLAYLIEDFQAQLAEVGVGKGDAISMALPNGLEFTVAFLGACAQRCISAPLNPAYTESEYKFYIDDLKSNLVIGILYRFLYTNV